ncbi:MAG: peptide chain release factor 2 [Oscillospiraceae bacterium]|jgi:peptide chain release factor 2|nr:peptide chain release factor 2 [Oscillospiraceae bacterium]
MFSTLLPKIKSLGKFVDVINSIKKIENFEKEIAEEGFWNDKKKSTEVLEKFKILKNRLENYKKLENDFNESWELLKFCESENDISLINEIKKSLKEIKKELETQTLSTFLSKPHDSNNAILTLHSGAGGTEAQDWTEMLFRMYSRWSENKNMKIKMLDFVEGEEAGFKTISVLVEGENAYGLLKSETGVHRLVRISPFDSSGKRHTSFAAVEVVPEIDDKTELNISPDDIKMDVFRASGAGGQKVNKTSSAVRLTHIPTGIVVTCQNERSQVQNRETATKTLKSKLLEIKEREKLEKIEDIKGVQKEITWGSQIRSYVFMPYTIVKDHRTNIEVGNVISVMDGNIDCFINAYLEKNSKL